MMSDQDTTHFGFERVARPEKAARVARVFDSVASRYDLMNDLMSGGLHRLWKRIALTMTALRPGQSVLDLAGGTGDLAAELSDRVGPTGRVVLADINAAMLGVGRDRLLDRGIASNVAYVQADAEQLPFPADSFDCITIAFGLRNVTDKERALGAMLAVLKPGGRLLVLEFSHPANPLVAKLYDQYSFRILPRMGSLVAGDADSYRYLAESIRMHPNQEGLRVMMAEAGFADPRYHNMTGGIVALHTGFKPYPR
jgi:demethylmenaquinone methyltransferase/2-methoxy-6-polyprenyl-1,4-benzoquinol methylase